MSENTNKPENTNNEDNITGKDLHDIVLKQYELLNTQSNTIRQLQIDKEEQNEEFSFAKIISFFKRDKNKKSDNEKSSFWSKLGNAISYIFIGLIRIIFKYKLTVAIPTLLGLIAGVIIYCTSEKVYESKIVFSSGVLTNSFYKSMSEVLSDAAKYSSQNLSKILNISLDKAEKIQSIEYSVYTDYKAIRDKEINDTVTIKEEYYPFFQLTYNVTDGSIMDEVEAGTFNYLTNNIYSHELLESQRNLLNDQLEKLESEKVMNDSLNVAINNKLNNQNNNQFFVKETGMESNGIILSQEESVEKILQTVYNLNRQYTERRKELNEEKNRIENDKFNIVSSHTSGFRPIFPRVRHILYYMFYGFAFGLGLSLILLIVGNLKKIVEKTEK